MTQANWLTKFRVMAQATTRTTEAVAIENLIKIKEITKEGNTIGKGRIERERSTLTLMIQVMLQRL